MYTLKLGSHVIWIPTLKTMTTNLLRMEARDFGLMITLRVKVLGDAILD